MKTNKQLCAEYNKITGENVTRFSSIRRGKERIRAATKVTKKITRRAIVRVKTRNKVRVDKKNYRSVRDAFVCLGLPLNQYRKVLAKLRVCQHAGFMGYRFKNIKKRK